MPRGQKRQPAAVNPITNYFSRGKRQDTKRSPNNENEVSLDQLKKQLQPKRGLGEKTNKKIRQPLREIGGASNANLNTGLKSTSEHREQWSVYSDDPTRFDGEDKKDAQPQKEEPSTASQQKPKIQGKEVSHVEPKGSSQEQQPKGSSQEQQPKGSSQEQPKEPSLKESSHEEPEESLLKQAEPKESSQKDSSEKSSSNKEDDSSYGAPFQMTDEDASDEDPYDGFFDDDDDDIIITKTRRPKRLEKPKVPTQRAEEDNDNDAKEEEDLVPQFSIPAPSPVFDEPLASFTYNDQEEHSASFPALFTTSLPNEDTLSMEKQDSKLRDDESSGKTAESLASTVPIAVDEQFEAHNPLPVPRGKTLFEKLGVQSQKSE